MAKESVFIRKELNSRRIGLVQQHEKKKVFSEEKRYYLRVIPKKDRKGALTFCCSLGGELVKINGEEENEFFENRERNEASTISKTGEFYSVQIKGSM